MAAASHSGVKVVSKRYSIEQELGTDRAAAEVFNAAMNPAVRWGQRQATAAKDKALGAVSSLSAWFKRTFD